MKVKRVTKKIHRVAKPVAKKTASKRAAKSTPTRKTATSKKTTTKKTATKKSVEAVSHPREMDKVTGFSIGSDQYVIAQELLKGGASRSEITERVAKLLPAKTRTGTPKPITNLVSSVYNNLVRKGFRTEESFKVLEPTPASKRKATLAAKGAAGK